MGKIYKVHKSTKTGIQGNASLLPLLIRPMKQSICHLGSKSSLQLDAAILAYKVAISAHSALAGTRWNFLVEVPIYTPGWRYTKFYSWVEVPICTLGWRYQFVLWGFVFRSGGTHFILIGWGTHLYSRVELPICTSGWRYWFVLQSAGNSIAPFWF
jgi:hypothetical protein